MTRICRISLCIAGAVSGAWTIALFTGWALDIEKTKDLAKAPPVSKAESGKIIMPPPVEIALTTSGAEGFQTKAVVLGAGDTLIDVLGAAGVSLREAFAASTSLNGVFDPRRLKAGQRLSITVRSSGNGTNSQHLDRFAFVSETDKQVVVEHEADDVFVATVQPIKHDLGLAHSKGTISYSFFNSVRDVGLPIPVWMQANQLLSQAVDFQRDISNGDRFAFGYEIYNDEDNGETHAGNLVYVSLDTKAKSLAYFRHETIDGFVTYFDEAGNSIASELMKTPVSTGRLSSSYGKRKHPVLGYTRMHKGLDFAATLGTPVLAAADGIVVQRRRNGSFGKYIRIRHSGELSTAYAHLDRYKDTLAPGDRVRLGDVIGYVGQTGLTTGSNLHFEILNDGQPVNPASVVAPPLQKLKGEALARFQHETAEIRAMLKLTAPTKNARGEPDEDALPHDKG